MLARKARHAADVVAVFVGDDNGVDILRSETRTFKPAFSFAQTKAAIEHDARGGDPFDDLDHQGIAFTAGPQ